MKTKTFLWLICPLAASALIVQYQRKYEAPVVISSSEEDCIQQLESFGYSHFKKEALSNETSDFLYHWCIRDENIRDHSREITAKRFHFDLFRSCFLFPHQQQKEIADVSTSLKHIAKQYLQTEHIKQTELQIVLAKRQSSSQFWHKDNSQKGVTIVIPLVDIPNELRGPTELIPLPGTQAKEIIHTIIPKNQVFIFDSRMIHRGLANKDEVLERPILVIRFDKKYSLPPGQGIFRTQFNRFIWGPVLYMCHLSPFY